MIVKRRRGRAHARSHRRHTGTQQKKRDSRGRRHSGQASDSPGSSNDFGAEGERLAAHQLKYIGAEYTVLHNRVVQGGGGRQQMDHIVVGPNGVFHIETKHWSGDIRFTAHGVERSRHAYEKDPTAQLYRHEYVLKELLRAGGMPSKVTGVLCFTHPQCQLEGKSPAFLTVKLDRLVHEIRSRHARERLNREQIAAIVRLIRQHSEPGHT
ncbi:nuclease-related domain-containing protein [Xylanibacillus composti]|nr:nuclease-related domain-containing protein [Xylanibacillus composti]